MAKRVTTKLTIELYDQIKKAQEDLSSKMGFHVSFTDATRFIAKKLNLNNTEGFLNVVVFKKRKGRERLEFKL